MQAESTFSGCELPSEKYYYALHSHCENARKVYISLLIEIELHARAKRDQELSPLKQSHTQENVVMYPPEKFC